MRLNTLIVLIFALVSLECPSLELYLTEILLVLY